MGKGSQQNGKGGSTGDDIPAGCSSYFVAYYNNKRKQEMFLERMQVNLGDVVVASTDRHTETECQVECQNGTVSFVQTIDIRTSCSKPLFQGQQFGALTIASFPDVPECAIPHTRRARSVENQKRWFPHARSKPAMQTATFGILIATILAVLAMIRVTLRRLGDTPNDVSNEASDNEDDVANERGSNLVARLSSRMKDMIIA